MNFSVGNSNSDALLSVVKALGDTTTVSQNAELKQKFDLVEATLELKAVIDKISVENSASTQQQQPQLYSPAVIADVLASLGQSPAGQVPQQDSGLLEALVIAEMLRLIGSTDDNASSDTPQPQFPSFEAPTATGHADPLAGWGQAAQSGGNTVSGSQNSQSGASNVVAGDGNSQDGEQNATLGKNNDVFGTGNMTAGRENGVDGEANLTIGTGNTVMKGDNNVAIGDNVTVKGSDNVVIGDNVKASGDNISVFIADGSTKAHVTAKSGQTVFSNSSGDILKINADDSWAKYNAAGKRLEGGKAGTAKGAGLHQQATVAARGAIANQQLGSKTTKS